tara:strand:- start:839 stop:958 length:120 start_codon:yes stop_codon:yes gene_type:complete
MIETKKERAIKVHGSNIKKLTEKIINIDMADITLFLNII